MSQLVASDRIRCPACGTERETSETSELGCLVCMLGLAFNPRESVANNLPSAFGTYVIEKHEDGALWELGRGSMGVTYRATDTSLQRSVALKIVKGEFAADGIEARERFAREARAAASLRHPNVATAYQFGIDQETGQSFYAMELVEGETLEHRVRRTGPMPAATVIEIARQVTAAVAAAEKRGLVHRDLKPANIMITSGEKADELTIKVIDFGLAKALAETPDARRLTQGGFVGTPAFASPEQLNRQPVDVRSDIYSLGATLWYLLTGHIPLDGRTDKLLPPVEQLEAAHVPARLISLLVSMLATEPAARPSVQDLSEQLYAIQKGLGADKTRPIGWTIAAVLVTLAGVAVIWGWRRDPVAAVIPEKSIAVLPFTSFGDEKESGYLADGVQDEILTDLTKVADLKVISRRSAAQFRDTKESVQAIGQALQVSHVLEGSVRKSSGRMHITVQLIDTRTGTETWAEKYEQDEADIFVIQSDIAQEVISRLKAELSPQEKMAIEQKPTQDMAAYDLYLRARSLVYETAGKPMIQASEEAKKAIELLEQAIARDPNFTLAYCVIADAQLGIADAEWSWDKSWKEKVKQPIDAALRISPNSPEAHLVRARYLIDGLDDPAAGEKDLVIAAEGLPGRAAIFSLRAVAEEQGGRWREALRDRERALELDPRESDPASDLAQLLICLRRYSQAERLTDHMLAILPKGRSGPFWRLKSHIALARSDTKGAMAALDSSPSRYLGLITLNQLVANLFILEREYAKAEEFFQSVVRPGKSSYVYPSKGGEPGAELFMRGAAYERLGRLARFQGQTEKANQYFTAARPPFEQWLAQDAGGRWGRGNASAYLAQIDAGLGRKDEAIREGRNTVKFWSEHDARVAPDTKIRLAITYLWSGEREAALQELSEVVREPAWVAVPPFCPGMSVGELELNPLWDELRGDPRFKKLITEAARPVSL